MVQAQSGVRVLLAAHQGLAVGGIGTMARGLAAHLPDAMEPYGSVVVEMPAAGDRLSGRLRVLGGPGAAARLWHEQARLARICLLVNRHRRPGGRRARPRHPAHHSQRAGVDGGVR